MHAFSPMRMALETCLKKPLSPAGFAKAIADVTDCAASSASRGPNEIEIL